MSTKIYYGFRVKPEELNKFMNEVIIPVAVKEYLEYAGSRSEEAAEAHARPGGYYCGLANGNEPIQYWGWRGAPDVDGYGVRFYLHEGWLYGYLYGFTNRVNCEVLELGVEKGLAEPSWYWNNTEKDENMSEEEWEERGNLWEHLLYEVYPLDFDIYAHYAVANQTYCRQR